MNASPFYLPFEIQNHYIIMLYKIGSPLCTVEYYTGNFTICNNNLYI